jgi:hypothetical protein
MPMRGVERFGQRSKKRARRPTCYMIFVVTPTVSIANEIQGS